MVDEERPVDSIYSSSSKMMFSFIRLLVNSYWVLIPSPYMFLYSMVSSLM
ncbi:MAG: hypothetical protein GF416_04385 [Candidatus Altiarchaeales archaeon]|nr:hypothetical protein [Candidatus Altiarchaeales archaeon]